MTHSTHSFALPTAVIAAVVLFATAASAEFLVPGATYMLDPALADTSSNFHPQGLAYDDATGELLFLQQSANSIIATDLVGGILGTRTIGQIDTSPPTATNPTANHTTGVAADATYYYFTDYTCNANCYDLHQIDKILGTSVHISSEIAAYGGYPIDVRAGMLYRTNNSTTYNWSNLDQVRVAASATPDTVLQTLSLAGTSGIGDMSVDLDGGNLWVLEYLPSASIHQFDLATGTLIDTFALGIDGMDAGIAYGNNQLYHYDWLSGSGSTLTVYDVLRAAAVRTVDAPDAIVTAGLSGYPVTVDVENTGANAVTVTSVDLSFVGMADRTAEYVVTPDPGNPSSIGPMSTGVFTFAVEVLLGATTELVTIDASFTGTDSVTMAVVVDMDADTTDAWDVTACLAPFCGDCNGDMMLTILDALVGAQHSAGLLTLTGAQFSNCNVLGTLEPDPMATVDILDALSIAQAAAGLPVALVCC